MRYTTWLLASTLILSCGASLGQESSGGSVKVEVDVPEATEATPPRSTVQIELWVVTLSPDATDEVMAEVSLPVDDRKAVLSRLRELEEQKLVTRSQYLMASALEEQQSILQLGSRDPRIQGVSQTAFGRQSSIVYESIGTILQTRSRVTSSHAIIEFQYEDSYLAPTDVAIFEPKEGGGENVNVDQVRQFTHHATVSCPDGGAVTVMASGGAKGSDQPATLMFLAARLVD